MPARKKEALRLSVCSCYSTAEPNNPAHYLTKTGMWARVLRLGHRMREIHTIPVRAILSAILFAGCATTPVVPTTTTSPTTSVVPTIPESDWPAYNRTLAGDRFSPLSEINTTNVA